MLRYIGQPQLIRPIGSELVTGVPISIDNHTQVVVDGRARLLTVLGPGLAKDREPRVGRAQPPRSACRHRIPGDLGLISQVPVPEFRVIGMGIEQGVGPIRLIHLGFRDRGGQPSVVGLA
jgi:hypothetical protein